MQTNSEKADFSKTAMVVLGAGTPSTGKQHSSLTQTTMGYKVIDWFKHATEQLGNSIVFVSGYQQEKIKELYPEFSFVENESWETTGAAYSLLTALGSCGEEECFVFYSDIVFREALVQKLKHADSDVVVAFDAQWKNRFSGRPQNDLDSTEKIICKNNRVTLLGQDIDAQAASGEFVGAVRLSSKAVSWIREKMHQLKVDCETAHLSFLVELLRRDGLTCEAIDVCGDWAELNHPKDLAHFVLGTKAQTLFRLQPMLKQSTIEKQVSFTTQDWKENHNSLINRIHAELDSDTVVVRSSALSEDGFSESNAGAYTSILNVPTHNESILRQNVEAVIQSYRDNHPENQVLVQPMLKNVTMSGVVFTRSLVYGAPYYTVNYDDQSGSTESITSGNSKEDKTIVIRKDASLRKTNLPAPLRRLIIAIKEIEGLLHYDSLDIEFAITQSDTVHILQVRPISVKHGATGFDEEGFQVAAKNLDEEFKEAQSVSPFVFGSRSIFGIMPDWNPAEIIGTKPRPLSFSLYKYIIMDDTWAKQRAEYGYKDVRPQNLMTSFAGTPFVNITASFSSFIPKNVPSNLANKLVECYLNRLETHPEFHDKVEFEVLPTCYSLDFVKWRHIFRKQNFSEADMDSLEKALIEITRGAIARTSLDLEHIAQCERRFNAIKNSSIPTLTKIRSLLDDCRDNGALPFAHLARSAFVAMSILKGAVSRNIISESDYVNFLGTIETVSHEFTSDGEKVRSGSLTWEEYVAKYGHLRPGTYEITSPCYADDADRFLKPATEIVSSSSKKQAPKLANTELSRKISNALAEASIDVAPDDLEKFLRESIEGREYAKFIFSKNLSLALNLLITWGESLDLDVDEISYLTIQQILGHRGKPEPQEIKEVKRLIAKEKSKHELNRTFELPPLLISESDFRCFSYSGNHANFVSNSSVTAPIVELKCAANEIDISGKIVLIEQADPGFDWIFGNSISGLITKYGGANSHMAIRSAEFGIPAAIGVGEATYSSLSKAKIVELDSGNKILRVLR